MLADIKPAAGLETSNQAKIEKKQLKRKLPAYMEKKAAGDDDSTDPEGGLETGPALSFPGSVVYINNVKLGAVFRPKLPPTLH